MNMPVALALVESFEPDVVLCDVQLPGGDGLTLLNRSLQIRPETLFIMITAYATVENAVAAFQRGAHDYLMKPVMFEELLAKIDRLMKYRRLLLENQALRRQLHAQGDLETLVGRSPPMQAVKTLDPQGRPDPEHGADHRRVGHRQGAGGPGPAHLRARPGRGVPGRQLRGDPARPAGEPALRPRPGRLHRRRSRPRGAVRRGGPGTVFLDEIGELGSPPRPSCSGPSRTRKSCPSARPGRSRSRPGW